MTGLPDASGTTQIWRVVAAAEWHAEGRTAQQCAAQHLWLGQ